MQSDEEYLPEDERSLIGKLTKLLVAFGLLAFIYTAGTTLAANISLGAGSTEFGQGVVSTTACDSQIIVKPQAAFDNTAAPNPATTPASTGVFNLQSLLVTDVDSSGCNGKWLTLKVFNTTDNSPLEIVDGFASISVLNTAGTYSTNQNGFTVTTNSSSSFTVSFTTPVATAAVVSKVTLESSDTQPVAITITYTVGNIGPGGGRIFFVSQDGFNCGSTHSSTGSSQGGLCRYLEAAPATWSGASADPGIPWASAGFTSTDVVGISYDFPNPYNNAAAIGLGYKNSVAIVNQGNTLNSAAGSARAYAGGGKTDWYLPTTAELNLLCQWARGVTQNVANTCSGGSDNAAFFTDTGYWASSAAANWAARVQYFNGSGAQDARGKGDGNKVRPIRAF